MSKSKRAKRTLRKQMLHKKFGELVRFMVEPIKRVIDYSSIARQIFKVEPLDKKDE
jgi:hypothetical protein